MFVLNFSLILYSLLFYALFLFLGLGLTIICCPREWRKYTVFLSPLTGYCLLTLAGWYFYLLNFKGTDDYYYWILLLALLLLIGALIKIWKQKFMAELFSRELIPPILIAAIIFVIAAFPALLQADLTSMSLGNNDIEIYTSINRFLQSSPKIDITEGNYIQELGAYLSVPFFCSVTKLDPYQVQMIELFIFFIISVMLTYIIGRETFYYSGTAANVIMLLIGCNSIMYYVIYHGFVRQVIAVPLMLLIVLSNVAVVRANKFRGALRYAPVLLLALWGLSQTYSHMLVIIYGLIIAYVVLSAWKNKKFAVVLNWAAINCIVSLVVVCLSPQRLQLIISNLLYLSSRPFGWFIPFTTPEKLYGLYPFLYPNIVAITISVSVFMAAVIIYGYRKMCKGERESFLLSITLFTLIMLGALILSFQNKSTEGFGGYAQFKLVSFFLPILLLSSLVALSDLSINLSCINSRTWLFPAAKSGRLYLNILRKLSPFLITVVMVIANCLSAAFTQKSIQQGLALVSADIAQLRDLAGNAEIKSINIPADNHGSNWNIMWESYFLSSKKLYFEQKTYYSATPLDGEWYLIRRAEKVLSILNKTDPVTIPINPTYSLKRASNITARFGKGWSDPDVNHRWSTSAVASIIINLTDDNVCTELTLKYWPLNKDNNLSIYLNNVKILDCDKNNYCVIKCLLLSKGENILEFRAKLPEERPDNVDPRKLCYCFQLIQLEEVK